MVWKLFSSKQVTVTDGTEPGWLGGELHGHSGWFPKDYCEPLDTKAEAETGVADAVVRTQLE